MALVDSRTLAAPKRLRSYPKPRATVRHHANSRRFKCACGEPSRIWGYAGEGFDVPNHVVTCACGVVHVRGA